MAVFTSLYTSWLLLSSSSFFGYYLVVPKKGPVKKGRRAGTPGSNTPKKRSGPPARGELVRARTIEEIWATLRDGFPQAEAKFLEYLEAAYHGLRLGDFALDDPDEKVRRRTSPHEYVSYGPPAWFEAPFCILKVFVREENRDYMSHGGEELLFNLPGSDGIEYEFFWPAGAPRPWLADRSTPGIPMPGSGGAEDAAAPVIVAPHQLIRINPSLPHRNRPVPAVPAVPGSGAADAWIILRPLSLSPATLILHPHGGNGSAPNAEEPHHKFSEARLRAMTGAQLLLIASGLLEKLRVHRLRSEMSVEDLSKECGLNRSYVGRLERLDFENFSIQTLYEISRQIDLDLLSCLRQLQWAHNVQIPPSAVDAGLVSYTKHPKIGHHLLHPASLRLASGQRCKIELQESSGEIVSIIMISGEMVPRLSGERNVPVVEAGHVFHARCFPEFTVHAHTDMEAVVIRYSQRCTCGNALKEES